MEEDLETKFLQIEKLFNDEMFRRNRARNTVYANLCCDDDDQTDIIQMSHLIKEIPEYNSLSYRDIFVVLIFIYYSLRFNEQSTDWLRMNFLNKNLINLELAKKLYYHLTIGDLYVENDNLSTAIRRHALGLKGGKKRKTKQRKYKYKSRRTKKNIKKYKKI